MCRTSPDVSFERARPFEIRSLSRPVALAHDIGAELALEGTLTTTVCPAFFMEVLPGTANLAFWKLFVATDALMNGYVTTILHWTCVAAQLIAAASTPIAAREVRSIAS
jgi:hypothetical protein